MNNSYLNADSVCEGLKKLRQNAPDEWIYVILDNAAYQRCKKVKQCAAELNTNLIYLPLEKQIDFLARRLILVLKGV